MPVYALAVILFGSSTAYAVGVVALFASGAGFLAIVSTTNTAVQTIVTDRLRGRVMAVRIMAFTLALPIGGLVQGLLAEAFGPRPVVTGAGILLLGVGLVFARRTDLLARLDDPEDLDEPKDLDDPDVPEDAA